MMETLEAAAAFFYDPFAYWGVPLLIAVVLEAGRRLSGRG